MAFRESSGVEVSRVAVKMDSVYARGPVKLESSFSSALLPGDYLVSLALSYEDGSVEAIDVPMNVPKPTEAEAAGAPTGAQTGIVNQAQPGNESGSNRVLPIVACVAAAVLVVLVLFVRRRRFAR